MIKKNFLRSFKNVLFGSVVAQFIPFLGSLLITRIYFPAEFGSYSIWLGAVMTAAVVVTCRLEMALGVEPDGEDRRFAMVAVLTTTSLVCIMLILVVISIYSFVPQIRDLSLSLILMFFPATFFLSLLNCWQSYASVEGAYRELSIIRIMSAFWITLIQIVIGYIFPDAVSLAIGFFIGVLLGLLTAAYFIPIDLSYFSRLSIFKSKLWDFWFKHRDFPRYALLADTINIISGQLPILIIGSKFGAEFSGFYAFTSRIVGAPISLFGAAALDVFKRMAAESYRKYGNCRKEYRYTFILLASLGAALAIGVTLIAESAFVFLFGETWRQSGVIAVWLVPLFAMRFVASPLSYTFYIAGKQGVDLIWQCTLLIMTLLIFYFLINFEMIIRTYAIGYGCLYILYLVLSYRYSSISRLK